MSLITRILNNVGSPLYDPSGNVLANKMIRFTLVNTMGQEVDVFDITGERVFGDVTTLTDANGIFSVSLWPNSRGIDKTQYKCYLDLTGTQTFLGSITEGNTPYSWIEFKKGQSLITPQDFSALTLHASNAEIHSNTDFSQDSINTLGLIYSYNSGNIRIDSSTIKVQSGTVTLNSNEVNYIEVSGNGTVTSNIIGFTSGNFPVAKVTTDTNNILLVDDRRGFAVIGSGGGGILSVSSINPIDGVKLSVANSTTAPQISLSLDSDLGAVENINTTGIVRRTGVNVWSAGSNVDLTNEVTGILPVSNMDLTSVVQQTTSVNGYSLSSNITLNSADISEGISNFYITSQERIKLSGVEVGANVNTVTASNSVLLTNKTYNGLSITTGASSYTLSGGTIQKSFVVDESTSLSNKVNTSTTINGKPLTTNITLVASDISDVGTVLHPISGSVVGNVVLFNSSDGKLLSDGGTLGSGAFGDIGTDILAPNGSASSLTSFPILNQNTTGTSSNVTGIISILNGGTGQNTQQLALNSITNVNTSSDENVLTKDALSGNAIWKPLPVNSGGAAKPVLQLAHGFVVGECLINNGISWVKAQANSRNTLTVGMVSEVADVDNFTIAIAGPVSGLSGLTAGIWYYLSDLVSGAITSIEPLTFSQPIFYADSASTGFVIPYRPTAGLLMPKVPTYRLTFVSGDANPADPVYEGVVPASPYQITVPNSLGSRTQVLIGDAYATYKTTPATAQFSQSGDVFTFSAADVGKTVKIKYGQAHSTLYYTPYQGKSLQTYDGNKWNERSPAELSIAIPASANTGYDVYVKTTAGVDALVLVAWSDLSTPPARTWLDGVECSAADTTKRRVGAFRTKAAGVSESSYMFSYLSNLYNTLPKPLGAYEDDNGALFPTYSIATWRQFYNSSRNELNVFTCVPRVVRASFHTLGTNSSSATATSLASIGLDGISDMSYSTISRVANGVNAVFRHHAEFEHILPVGHHNITALQKGAATTLWYTSVANGAYSKLVGTIDY